MTLDRIKYEFGKGVQWRVVVFAPHKEGAMMASAYTAPRKVRWDVSIHDGENVTTFKSIIRWPTPKDAEKLINQKFPFK